MKTPSLAVACGFVLIATFLMGARNGATSSMMEEQHNASQGVAEEDDDAAGHPERKEDADCGGEPCDAVARGLRAFFDRRLAGLDAQRPLVRRLPHGDRPLPALTRQRRGAIPPAPVPATLRSPGRRPAVPADRRRRLPHQRRAGERFQQSSPERPRPDRRFRCRRTCGSIDPATNMPSAETFVDVWRMVPTVNDVALTGPDGINPWPRAPNFFGGYQLDARVGDPAGAGAGCADQSCADSATPPPQQLLDDLASFQRVLFTNHRVRALSDALRDGTSPLPDPDPPLNALEQQGKAVFERACAQCHGGPGQSTAQAPVVRFHDILTQCPRPVDTVTPARFAFAPCPPRLARNARTYEITLHNGITTRRTSSDPGRALLTGFVGGPAPGTTGTSSTSPGFAGSARPRRTSTTTAPPRSKRWSITTSSSSSASRRSAAPGAVAATGRHHGRREFRPAAAARRARGAARVPAKAVRARSTINRRTRRTPRTLFPFECIARSTK